MPLAPVWSGIRGAIGLASLALFASATGVQAEVPDFESRIAPILANHCLACHQPTKKSGELNLTTRESLLKGGESGPAMDEKRPAESNLLARVRAGEMPPPEAKESKPLSAAELAALTDWMEAGAPWPKGRELGIHEKSVDLTAAKSFWSFQPVQRPALPNIHRLEQQENAVDAFVLAELEAHQLQFSSEATRRDVLRRVSLDLRGLPPTLEEQEAFLHDDAPDAHERLVDRLLSDPAYGERWARHWLDLVRYADSNGYERDGAKPNVWKYRDYVIRAFNDDKPYDQFVIEQLAGDELPEPTYDTLIATGFHALGAWQDEVDPLEAAQYRADELDDMLRTTSQTFLGLTIGCARCHNHKFDPLTMVDYYSLAAIFAPLKRPNFGRIDGDVPFGTPEQIAAEQQRNLQLLELNKELEELKKKGAKDDDVRIAELREKQAQLKRDTPHLPRIYRQFEDRAEVPPTHLLLSGRANSPGPAMQPRVPAVLVNTQPVFPLPAAKSTLRRLTLARWIASRDNPLTARVLVNRVWQQHFGTGIVATSSDFGEKGARPTHPKLLDYLAAEFRETWSLKRLHRQVLTSQTYRQSSAWSQTGSQRDPENRLLWRYPYRRLDVEALRDSMLAAAGNLNRTLYGPAVYLPIPQAAIEAHTDKEAAWKAGREPEINRRTVYAFIKRTLLVPMLETLDFCDTTNSTERRSITSVAPQALTLYNGDFVNRQAVVFAERLAREAGDNLDAQIDLAFRLALSRPPQPQEAEAMRTFAESQEGGRASLVQLCRALLNLNEFAYPN
jgi:hypothetical protein